MRQRRKQPPSALKSRVPKTVLIILFVFLSLAWSSSATFASSTVIPPLRMNAARVRHTATLLPNGTVLIAGGYNYSTIHTLNTAEIYDPSTGTFTATGNMNYAREFHTATLLPNGKVLITGGVDSNSPTLNTAEIYDPSTGTFTATGNMNSARQDHTATLLPNGKVLILGGRNYVTVTTTTLNTAEIYDPSTGTFAVTGNMWSQNADHAATLLPNGTVLIISMAMFSVNEEIYDPSTGTYSIIGRMNYVREMATSTLLPNGTMLIAGGWGYNPTTDYMNFEDLNTAEIYDPSTRTFTTTGNMNFGTHAHTATLLPNGTVLIAGGGFHPSSARIYDPSTGTFTATGDMNFGRLLHTATLLPNGTALITGGLSNCAGVLDTAEIYDPPTGTFITTNKTNTVTALAGTGGTIDPPTLQTVTFSNCGTSFTIKPDPGYYIDSVTGCGNTLSGNTYWTRQITYRTGMITDDCTVTAAFARSATTSPVTTASVSPSPNGVGWNNTNVMVTLTSIDDSGGSGVTSVAYTLSGAQIGSDSVAGSITSFTISMEGVTTVGYYAQDNAGNTEATKTLNVRIDKTLPVITFGTACPSTAILNSTTNVTVTASDALSGVASQSAPDGNNIVDTSTVGPKTFTVTVTDNAGNSTTNSCDYRVTYDFAGAGGFASPLASPPTVNKAKAGNTIPVKWQLPNGNGGFISDLGVVADISYHQVQCSDFSASLTIDIQTTTSGSSGLHYDTTTNQFVYNWKTSSAMAGNCYMLVLTLNDGSQYAADFSLK